MLVVQGAVAEYPLRVGDLDQLRYQCLHPVIPSKSAIRGGEHAMDVLNGGKFHRDLAM